MSQLLVLVSVCFWVVSACPQLAPDDTDLALLEVFGSVTTKPNEIIEPDDRAPISNPNPGYCECVPFYQCKNGTINEYGEDIIDIKIDQDEDNKSQCPHYLDICCNLTDELPPTIPPIRPMRSPQCGVRNADGIGFKITGSHNEANYGEFPWMVAVIRKDHVAEGVDLKVMECGGSIIHPSVILTGAHCVKGKKGLFIRAGEWDTQTQKEIFPTQDREVKQVIIHEQYYAGGLHNDVALLVLEKPLELNEVIDTICLPEQDENMDGRNCLSSGWGKNLFGKEGEYAVILKKIDLPIVPRDPCQAGLRKTRLGPRFRLHQTFICAGGEEGKDTCKGDGGSPLVCPSKTDPRLFVQAGIVAWGIGCGGDVPGVYVNVPHFRNWIDNKMASLQLSD